MFKKKREGKIRSENTRLSGFHPRKSFGALRLQQNPSPKAIPCSQKKSTLALHTSTKPMGEKHATALFPSRFNMSKSQPTYRQPHWYTINSGINTIDSSLTHRDPVLVNAVTTNFMCISGFTNDITRPRCRPSSTYPPAPRSQPGHRRARASFPKRRNLPRPWQARCSGYVGPRHR